MNKHLTAAKHPKTGEEYSIGDNVCIYQGRNGHNNIITIRTIMLSLDGDLSVSAKEIKPEDINNPEILAGSFTYLSAVKEKLTLKQVRAINKAKQLVSRYE